VLVLMLVPPGKSLAADSTTHQRINKLCTHHHHHRHHQLVIYQQETWSHATPAMTQNLQCYELTTTTTDNSSPHYIFIVHRNFAACTDNRGTAALPRTGG